MKPSTPVLPAGCAEVAEVATPGLPALSHPVWTHRHPWLVQGTTTRGPTVRPFDLGLFSDGSPPSVVMEGWERLRQWAGVDRVVHGRQVHEAAIRFHGGGVPGLHLTEPCDGHATSAPGLLLAVTIADCVPVFLVEPAERAVVLLHAGWRGVAAGILEGGIRLLSEVPEALGLRRQLFVTTTAEQRGKARKELQAMVERNQTRGCRAARRHRVCL